MAYATNYYTGDGTTKNFVLSFPYIDASHVKVTVDGALVATANFVAGSIITTQAAPPAGSAVKVYRETPRTPGAVVFYNGSTLLDTDLNAEATQALYILQELSDRVAEALAVEAKDVTYLSQQIARIDATNAAQDNNTATALNRLDQVNRDQDNNTAAGLNRIDSRVDAVNATLVNTNAKVSADSARIDALVAGGVVNPGTGSPTTPTKVLPPILPSSTSTMVFNVSDFGATEDGNTHQVSELYTVGAANYLGYKDLTAVRAAYGITDAAATDTIDWLAYQAAINMAQNVPALSERTRGTVASRAGKRAVFNRTLIIQRPIVGRFLADLNYYNASGSMFIINPSLPTDKNISHFDLEFGAARQIGGNGALPTRVGTGGAKYSETGATAFEIRGMLHSRLKFLGDIQAFTCNAIWFNSSGVYSGSHTQGNTVELCGLIAYNGRGLFLDSADPALYACQANDFLITNIVANFEDVRLDRDTVTNPQSNNNRFHFKAKDKPACLPDGSGSAIILNGGWNRFTMAFMENTDGSNGYTANSFTLGSAACFNNVHVYTQFDGMARFYAQNAATTSKSNVLTTDQPFFDGSNTHNIPRTEGVGSGAGPFPVRQNLSGRTITVSTMVYVSGSQTVEVRRGRTASSMDLIQKIQPAAGAAEVIETLCFTVMPGDFYQITSSARTTSSSYVDGFYAH